MTRSRSAIARDDELANRLMIGSGLSYDATAAEISFTAQFKAVLGDEVRFVAPTAIDGATDALTMVEDIALGVDLALTDFDGEDVSASRLIPGRVYSMLRLVSEWRILVPLLGTPTVLIKAALSVDETLTTAEIAAGTESTTGVITAPTWADDSTHLRRGAGWCRRYHRSSGGWNLPLQRVRSGPRLD